MWTKPWRPYDMSTVLQLRQHQVDLGLVHRACMKVGKAKRGPPCVRKGDTYRFLGYTVVLRCRCDVRINEPMAGHWTRGVRNAIWITVFSFWGYEFFMKFERRICSAAVERAKQGRCYRLVSIFSEAHHDATLHAAYGTPCAVSWYAGISYQPSRLP